MMSTPSTRIAILASGSGTNAEAIMAYFEQHPAVKVTMVLSNNPGAFVLQRAEKFHIPAKVFNREQFRESDEVVGWLRKENITHIVLAGFLWLIPPSLVNAFPDRIINIHPALLPKFGGKGMYGARVHEAVKLAGEKITGISIHAVNEHYDEGAIIFQAECTIDPEDSIETIARKVHQLEHEHFPREIEKWVQR